MDLANFERRANSGAPVVGARATLYAATAIDPTTPLATTFTDANGYWAFTGLALGTYDILVEAPGSGYKKWYKGQVKIGVDQLAVSSGFSPAPGTVPGTALVAGSVTTTQIADGTILNADIANATIASAKLAAGAAGLISSTSFGPLSTTSTAIVGMTGSDVNGVVTTGKRVLIGATLVGLGVGGAATPGSAVQVFKDGVVFQQVINQAMSAGLYTTVTATWTDVPTAATHSWFLAWMTTAGCTFSCNAGILWIAEIRGG